MDNQWQQQQQQHPQHQVISSIDCFSLCCGRDYASFCLLPPPTRSLSVAIVDNPSEGMVKIAVISGLILMELETEGIPFTSYRKPLIGNTRRLPEAPRLDLLLQQD